MEKGDIKLLLSPKKNKYELIDIIENPDITLEYDFHIIKCPKCGHDIKEHKIYNLTKVYKFKSLKDGSIGYKGETLEGELVRFPDDSFYPGKKIEIENKLKEVK